MRFDLPAPFGPMMAVKLWKGPLGGEVDAPREGSRGRGRGKLSTQSVHVQMGELAKREMVRVGTRSG